MSIQPRPYAVLCGGLGGSRFVDALARAAGPEQVTAIVNVGDDLEILGLRRLPGPRHRPLHARRPPGRGARLGRPRRDDERARARAAPRRRDVVHARRSRHRPPPRRARASSGRGPALRGDTARTERLGVGVGSSRPPTTRVRTFLTTPAGELDFQTWFVARRHADEVTAVRYEGAEASRPAPGCPRRVARRPRSSSSRPRTRSSPSARSSPCPASPRRSPGKRVVAVSPLVGGKRVARAAGRDAASLGHEPGVRGAGRLYAGSSPTSSSTRPTQARAARGARRAHRYGCAASRERTWAEAVLEAIR